MNTLAPWTRGNGLLERLHGDMDRLFGRFFGEPFEEVMPTAKTWAPRVDVEETEKEFLVKADLPGVEPKNVEVSMVDGSLVLKGERKEESEEKQKNYHRTERFVGEFYRMIPLPAGVDPDKISATCTKGVITVTIPKKPEVMPKKIPIKAVE